MSRLQQFSGMAASALIVLPILDIYRKYYGLKIGGFLLATFYVSMALAALRRATERACLI